MPLDRKKRQRLRKGSLVEISAAVNPVQQDALITIIKDKGEHPMPEKKTETPEVKEDAALKEQVAELTKDLATEKEAREKAEADLAAYKDEVAKKEAEAEEARKAADESEPAYVADDGTIYAKDTDPGILKIVKDNDELKRTLKDKELTERAKDYVVNDTEVDAVKSALGAIESIKDEKKREAVIKLFTSRKEALKPKGTTAAPKEAKEFDFAARKKELMEGGMDLHTATSKAYAEKQAQDKGE